MFMVIVAHSYISTKIDILGRRIIIGTVCLHSGLHIFSKIAV